MRDRWEWGRTWGSFVIAAAVFTGGVNLLASEFREKPADEPPPGLVDWEAMAEAPVDAGLLLLEDVWAKNPAATATLLAASGAMALAFIAGLALWLMLWVRAAGGRGGRWRIRRAARRRDLSGRLECRSGMPPAWSAREAVLLLSLWMLALFGVSILLIKVTHPRLNLAVLGLGSLAAGLFGLHLAERLLRGRVAGVAAALGWTRRGLAKNVLQGVAGYALALPLMLVSGLLWSLTLKLLGREVGLQQAMQMALETPSALELGAFIAIAVVAAPVIEETLFRGVLYPALRWSTGPFAAMLLSGAVFAVVHGDLSSLMSILSLGTLLAYLYERTGSLVAPVVTHALNNGLSLTLVVCIRALTG